MRTRDLFIISICNFLLQIFFVSKVLALYSHCHETVTLYTDVVSPVPIYLLSDALSCIVAGRKSPVVIKRLDVGKHVTSAAYTSNSGLQKKWQQTSHCANLPHCKLKTPDIFIF
uniref:Uncharacterized protein n=1 Tax=Rhipicephalus zambeziensis TaxID=60191 RepID=A0A224YLF7_9ACAR